MANVVIFFLFYSVPEIKTLCTFYLTDFASNLQKPMRSFSNGSHISQQKSIAKTVALNYVSPNLHRITHHAQIFTVTVPQMLLEKTKK